MVIGVCICWFFGWYEYIVVELYWFIYVDFDVYVDQIVVWVFSLKCILEVGCGEGVVIEWLVKCFFVVEIVVIDIMLCLGCLF